MRLHASFIIGSTTTPAEVNECRCKFRPKYARCLALLREVFTGGSVRAEPWRERQMLPEARRRQGVPPVHSHNGTKALIRYLQKDHDGA